MSIFDRRHEIARATEARREAHLSQKLFLPNGDCVSRKEACHWLKANGFVPFSGHVPFQIEIEERKIEKLRAEYKALCERNWSIGAQQTGKRTMEDKIEEVRKGKKVLRAVNEETGQFVDLTKTMHDFLVNL